MKLELFLAFEFRTTFDDFRSTLTFTCMLKHRLTF